MSTDLRASRASPRLSVNGRGVGNWHALYRWTWIWRITVRRIFAYDGRYAWSQSDAYQVFVICIRRILHMADQFFWSHRVRHIQVHLYLLWPFIDRDTATTNASSRSKCIPASRPLQYRIKTVKECVKTSKDRSRLTIDLLPTEWFRRS